MYKKKILIIEDEKIIQNFLKLSLKLKEYDPIIAENGYVDGHYFESKNAAFSDLKKRSISQLNVQISKQMVHLKINKDRTL